MYYITNNKQLQKTTYTSSQVGGKATPLSRAITPVGAHSVQARYLTVGQTVGWPHALINVCEEMKGHKQIMWLHDYIRCVRQTYTII